jgi:hypothetical protein
MGLSGKFVYVGAHRVGAEEIFPQSRREFNDTAGGVFGDAL